MDLITSQHQITSNELSALVTKIKADLQYGVKVFGNELNRNDVIRVWTTTQQNMFGVIATSGNRYDTTLNLLEIQSFKGPECYKLTVLNSNTPSVSQKVRIVKLNDNFLELSEEVTKQQCDLFIQEYLASKPDIHATKDNFLKYAYNKKQYQWLKPELYETQTNS